VLAVPREHPPPTKLPAEFHNYVQVYEIIDSHFPGYVYLKLRYLLTQCSDDVKYNYTEYDEEVYSSTAAVGSDERHGPARFNAKGHPSLLPYDVVFCIRTVVWCGRHKPLIGQHDTETTAGQTRQLLIVLSATGVMWFMWHIVSVDVMNGWTNISGDCHSHEQKLY